MCYFDQHLFACGDWKWGYFRQHCDREYRNGEACGMRLVMQTYRIEQKCKICEKIDLKRRRLAREQDRLRRWAREGNKYSASIEKVQQAIATLDTDIYELVCERQKNSGAIRAMEEPETDLEGKSQSLADVQTTNSSTGAQTIRAERRWQVVGPEDKLHFRGQMSDSEKARFILKSTSSRQESETSQRDLPKKNGHWGLAPEKPHKFVGSSSTLDDPNLDPVRDDSDEKNGLTPAQNILEAQNRAASQAFRKRKELHVKDHKQNFGAPRYLSSSEQAPASSNPRRFISRHVYDASRNTGYDASQGASTAAIAQFDHPDREVELESQGINRAPPLNLDFPRISDSKWLFPPLPETFIEETVTGHGAPCPMSTPKLFITGTISQDCTRDNCSSLLIALKKRPTGLRVKSSGIEEGDRKRIRLR